MAVAEACYTLVPAEDGGAEASALVAELKADPKIGAAHIGGIPVTIGGQFAGALAVSGAPGGEKDEACAMAGLAKIADRLH